MLAGDFVCPAFEGRRAHREWSSRREVAKPRGVAASLCRHLQRPDLAGKHLHSPAACQPLKSHNILHRQYDSHRVDQECGRLVRRATQYVVPRKRALLVHGTDTDSSSLEATREEMSAARLPLPYRDGCAHLLIPLNDCRRRECYLPWKCEV